MTGPVALTWAGRPDPLPAAAVTAAPSNVQALLAATEDRVRHGTTLRVAAGDGCLVLGAADDLPWSPGALYLGWDGGLLVPTTQRPIPPADLLLPALRAVLPPECDLVALLPWGVLATRAPVRPATPDGLAALVDSVTDEPG